MKKSAIISFSILVNLLSHQVLSDDIDIYITSAVNAKARVLFVIDESGSMAFGDDEDEFLDDNNPNQRTHQVKTALKALIKNTENNHIFMAIMGYRGSEIDDPSVTCQLNDVGKKCRRAEIIAHTKFHDLELPGSSAALTSAVEKIGHKQSTPTSSAMHDAVMWFKQGINATRANGNKEFLDSPIVNYCQPNHIVLLSDGAPNTNSIEKNGWGYYDNEFDNNRSCEITDKTKGELFEATETYQDGRCSPDFAAYAYHSDLHEALDGTQFVTTHTVGFHTTPLANIFLDYIAEQGGGKFLTANNTDDLTAVLQSFTTAASTVIDSSINTPTIRFDPANVAVSENNLYLPMYKPAINPFWFGNLKKYQVKISPAGQFELIDADGRSALNEDNSLIDTARSLWSSTTDGNNPLAGGSAAKRTDNRNLYTYVDNQAPSNILSEQRLFDFDNERAHPDISKEMLQVANPTAATALLKWISQGNGYMGAPLHSAPRLLNYQNRDGQSQQIVFMLTTEGVLSAIDAESGSERWAYMPSELLKNIKPIKYQIDHPDQSDASADRLYGLDGHLEIIHKDVNSDNLVNGDDSVIAIFGMRRGGRNYYALDITAADEPMFKWKIIGGKGDFKRLGQTWAKPASGKINIDGQAREVILFSGGYDPAQDDFFGARTTDMIGNAVYLVDAHSGKRIWWASSDVSASLQLTDMSNSIAADAMPVDVDSDGMWDRIYIADTGGRILRIDFYTDANGFETINGYTLADLNGNTADTNRQFFARPEVGFFDSGSERFYAILAGSGNRPAPMDHSVQNRFYMIKDYHPWSPQRINSDYVIPQLIIEDTSHCNSEMGCSQLYDASSNLVQSGSVEERQQALGLFTGTSGWFIDLGHKEMTANHALLHNHNIYFTTFAGGITPAQSLCDPADITFTSRFYALNLRTAAAVIKNFDSDATKLSSTDRSLTLNISGLPSAPAIFLVDEALTDDQIGAAPINKLFIGSGLEIAVSFAYRPIPLWWEEVINVD